MKKMNGIALGIALMLCISGVSMTISTIEVPQAVQAAFAKKFPQAEEIEWETEDETTYEVDFTLHNRRVSAYFEADGTWLETEAEISAADLPEAIKNTIATEFANYEMEGIKKVEKANADLTYEVELESEEEDMAIEVLFDEDGQVLSRDDDEDDDDGYDDDDGN